ncbi:MAG TPA: hypothetical protein PLV92_24315, partial [Pirellulaceae bacterium]|nr:hypothetical protein [Pirellulaceae bacterium]
MSVTSNGPGSNPRVFTLTYQNALAGVDVPDATIDVLGGAGLVSAANASAAGNFIPLAVTDGRLGVNTEVPAAGGIQLFGNGAELFAEGAARTLKWLQVDDGRTYRLGSRSDFGSTFGNNWPLTVSQLQIGAINTNTLVVDDPATSVQLGGADSRQLISFDIVPASFTLTYNGATTGAITTTGNAATDAAAVASQLNGLSTIGGTGGAVTVTAATGASGTYGFVIRFGGSMAASEVFGVTATGGGATVALARGRGSITQRSAGGALQKSGVGTLVVAGPNALSGAIGVSQGVLRAAHSAALGAANGLASTGTTISAGAALLLDAGLTIGNEYLSLAGDGFAGDQTGSGANRGVLRAAAGATTMWGNGATTIVLASSPNSTSPTSTSPSIGVDDGGWLVLDSQILQAATGV